METPVTFLVDGQQIVGMFHTPQTRAPAPAVAFLHGFRGDKVEPHRIFVKMARALCQHGIAALRFDFRGSGDSAGEFSEVTLSGEIRDARAALDFLRGAAGVDAQRLGLLGLSLGGLVAVLTAAQDRRVRALALWGAVAEPRRAVQQKTTPETAAQLQARGVADLGGWPIGAGLVRELMSAEPLRTAERLRVPTLVVHGEQDEEVPPAEAVAYEEALRRGGAEVERHMIRGAGHTFDGLAWEAEVVAVTLAWFQKHL